MGTAEANTDFDTRANPQNTPARINRRFFTGSFIFLCYGFVMSYVKYKPSKYSVQRKSIERVIIPITRTFLYITGKMKKMNPRRAMKAPLNTSPYFSNASSFRCLSPACE